MTQAQVSSASFEIASEIAERFRTRICFFAARRLHDRSLAEDVAQETMRVVVQALQLQKIENLDALPAFVFQTARNICMHHARGERRRAQAMVRFLATHTDVAADDVLRSLISRERIDRVRAILASLDAHERHLLELFFVDGLDAETVGARLSISAGAARVRKHRLLARLAAAEDEMK